MKIQVSGYSGFKVNERPCDFVLEGHRYQVQEILDRWYGSGYDRPESAYFKVLASDGNVYILRYHTFSDEWSLESFRRAPEGSALPVPQRGK